MMLHMVCVALVLVSVHDLLSIPPPLCVATHPLLCVAPHRHVCGGPVRLVDNIVRLLSQEPASFRRALFVPPDASMVPRGSSLGPRPSLEADRGDDADRDRVIQRLVGLISAVGCVLLWALS